MTLHNYRLMCLPATFLRDGASARDCLGGATCRAFATPATGSPWARARPSPLSLALHRATGSFDAVTRFLAVGEFVKAKHVEAGIDPTRILVKPNFVPAQQRRSGPGGRSSSWDDWRPRRASTRCSGVGRRPRRPPRSTSSDPGRTSRRCAPLRQPTRGCASSARVSPDLVPGLLTGARALLTPSRWYEAAPRTIVEAYASGVPVIASDIGALPDSVERGVSGLLVPPERPDAWAEAIRSLLDDEMSIRLGNGAHGRWRERYSPEVGLAELEACYRVALEARGP